MSSSSELIKDRLSIADVVGSYIKLEKAGANYKAKCPFHHEKTPSFMISPGRNSYYCFGCGAKGDIFTFVQEFEKVDFIGALKMLADKAGVELTQYKSDSAANTEMERLRSILDRATNYFQDQLNKGSKEYEYLTGRGLTAETIKDWRIGFAPNEWRRLHDSLKSVTDADMETVGLIKKSEKGDGVYDRFRSRVIFPLFDASSRVIGYSGRLFGVPDTEGPKYLNSPDTPLFNKSDVLYGYHKAKEGIRQWKYAILVEGQMDLLMCHQAGFTNAVATSGTSLTLAHLAKLKKLSDNLMIVYDADSAGLKATLRAWTAALSIGMDVKIAALPKGEDPASLILVDKEKFKEALKHSKHIIEYQFDWLMKQGLADRKLWQAVEMEILPFVAALESAIQKSHFLATISLQTGIPEESLREQLHKTKAVGEGREALPAENSLPARAIVPGDKLNSQGVIERLVGIAAWKSDLSDSIHARIQDVTGTSHVSVEANNDALAFEAEMIYSDSKHIDKDIDELFFELEERLLKSSYSTSMTELSIAERKGEKEHATELFKTCQELSRKISELNIKKSKK